MNKNYDQVLKICFEKLKYFNYSDRTIDVYCACISKFLIEIDKYIQHLTSKDFQDYLNEFPFSSVSQQNQIISSIKFLYEKVLNKKYSKIDFTRPRKEKKLPRIIDQEYLLKSIDAIQNIKHKSIISIAYSVGLRVSEVINLKITDIDTDRMIIIIRQAKGRRDRITPMTERIHDLLMDYVEYYNPKDYLFEGQFGEKYSATSCNKLIKKYLGKDYHFHLLRHSAFTHLTDKGIDLRAIQKLAGHKSSRTTEIYTHVSIGLLHKLPLAI